MPRSGALDLAERDLVAVDMPPGPAWRRIVDEVVDAGAAILPVDSRLPTHGREALVRAARPTVSVSASERGLAARRLDGAPVGEGITLVVATSGTSGAPKLVELERRAVDAAVSASARALDASAGDGWLCCLPPAHVAGMLVLFRAVLLDAPLEVHPSFEPSRIASVHDVAFVSLVPTMLTRLLDAGVDLSSFRRILVGGAHLAPEVRERAERAGAPIVETYGMTESCGGVVYDGVPLGGVGVRVDDGGRVELAGPTLMKRYRFDPRATAEAFGEDGWLQTRDAGEIDANGALRVHGRVDDAIRTGGETVWPREVEAVIAQHPKVAEVSVVGRADADRGERVVAVVVAADPSDPPTLDEVRDLAVERLGRHKAPRELEVVARLPTSIAGKVRPPSRTRG